VIGTLLQVKHSVPRMVAGGRRSFIGMSSVAGHQTHRYVGPYTVSKDTVSKAGIELMIPNAAEEYGEMKLRFNAVQPGLIATETMEAIPRDSGRVRKLHREYAHGDVGQPEDVTNLVRFLLGPESSWDHWPHHQRRRRSQPAARS
jgi:NAD(P)-dependent dehydrogenase (short-subunit alcohol dehydrogenase family)